MLWSETGLPWVNPSPNIRNPTAALVYAGMGCFEATNLSVGRGTDAPFEWFGAPWLNAKAVLKNLERAHLPGFSFRLETKTPADDLYKGQPCRGLRIRVTDARAARPVTLFVHLMTALREHHSYEFVPRWDEMRRMVGNDEFQKLYLAEEPAEAILQSFLKSTAQFQEARKPYLLYE